MSNLLNNTYYQDYKTHLAAYSKCIKPVIEAAYEQYYVQETRAIKTFNLENYCVYERKNVEHFRNLIKNQL